MVMHSLFYSTYLTRKHVNEIKNLLQERSVKKCAIPGTQTVNRSLVPPPKSTLLVRLFFFCLFFFTSERSYLFVRSCKYPPKLEKSTVLSKKIQANRVTYWFSDSAVLSTGAEISFSALRRQLHKWDLIILLCAICHQDKLDYVYIIVKQINQQFISVNDMYRHIWIIQIAMNKTV